MNGKPEAEMSDAELIAKACLYANQFVPGWTAGSIFLWKPGRRRPKFISFTPERGDSSGVTAEMLKELMHKWAGCGPAWRGCSIAFRIGDVGELPLESLVIRNLPVAVA